MARVTFLPVSKTVEAKPGQSILDVALDHDIPLMHACGGFCACTTCHVRVQPGGGGMQALSAPEDEELDRLESLTDGKANSRLGCQARVLGDVTVEIVNLDD